MSWAGQIGPIVTRHADRRRLLGLPRLGLLSSLRPRRTSRQYETSLGSGLAAVRDGIRARAGDRSFIKTEMKTAMALVSCGPEGKPRDRERALVRIAVLCLGLLCAQW